MYVLTLFAIFLLLLLLFNEAKARSQAFTSKARMPTEIKLYSAANAIMWKNKNVVTGLTQITDTRNMISDIYLLNIIGGNNTCRHKIFKS